MKPLTTPYRLSHRAALTAALLISLLSACRSMPEPYPREKRYLVAALQVQNKSNSEIKETDLDAARAVVMNTLHQGQRVRLLERERVDELLAEKKLEQSGLVSVSEAMQAGQLLGSEAVLLIQVNSVSEEKQLVNTVEVKVEKVSLTLTLSGRIIDTRSGEILATAVTSAEDDGQSVKTSFSTVNNLNRDELAGRVLKEAADELGHELLKTIPTRHSRTPAAQ